MKIQYKNLSLLKQSDLNGCLKPIKNLIFNEEIRILALVFWLQIAFYASDRLITNVNMYSLNIDLQFLR